MGALLRSYGTVCQSRWLWVITLVAVLLFSASMNVMSLKSYDDCHYAQKGVEMWQRGAFFTVTWAGRTDFQYPPLQFWLLGRSFALFGKIDPTLLASDNNQVFKQKIEVARTHLEPGTTLPCLGGDYWVEANPLLYYWDTKLERPGDTTEEVVAKALASRHRSLICVRDRLNEVAETGVLHETMVEG